MKSRRLLKAASAIREVVSTAILLELRDPRVQHVTVTAVEVAPDMRLAKVYVSVMGDERQQQLCMHGLRHSAGFLQQRIGERIDTRYIPRLEFVLDKGVKHALEVARILNEVLPAERAAQAAAAAAAEPHADDAEDLDEGDLDEGDLDEGDAEAGDAEQSGRRKRLRDRGDHVERAEAQLDDTELDDSELDGSELNDSEPDDIEPDDAAPPRAAGPP